MKRLLPYLPKPAVIFIAGKRGGGKTAKAFDLSSALHRRFNIPVYCYKPKNVFLPRYFKEISLDPDKVSKQKNSVWLLDDAHLRRIEHLSVYARDWYMETNKLMDTLQTMSRQLDLYIIYTTQETTRIDKNIILGSDALILCEPSLLADRLERKEFLNIIKEAKTIFQSLPKAQRKTTAYILTSEDKILLKNIRLPYYWSNKLSKSFAGYFQKKKSKHVLTIKL